MKRLCATCGHERDDHATTGWCRSGDCSCNRFTDLSAAQAKAVLREYPDADLSAFVIEGDPDVDQLAQEAVDETMEAIRKRIERA